MADTNELAAFRKAVAKAENRLKEAKADLENAKKEPITPAAKPRKGRN